MTFRPASIPPAPAALRQRLGHLAPVLVQILFNRGRTTEAQVQGLLEGHYLASTDPLLMGMETAVFGAPIRSTAVHHPAHGRWPMGAPPQVRRITIMGHADERNHGVG